MDLILVDFNYDYEDIRCSVEIKLLLQITMEYRNNNDKETWILRTGERKVHDYYIVSPRFGSLIMNENALNYGDTYYKKSEDEGAIIQMATLNYEGLQIVYDYDMVEAVKLTALSALSGIADIMIGSIPFVGEAYSVITDINDIISTWKDETDFRIETISQGTDGEILNKSRAIQEKEGEGIPYSRVMATTSQDQIFLSDDENSYMRCNTILDNASDMRSRIV